MWQFGGSDERKWSGVAFGRGSVAFALALALFLGAPAIADKVPPGWDQWDYWGRSRPLPFYVRVWSADDGVCRRIVKALNAAGPSPASLYGDPIFLRWQPYPVDMRRNEFDQTFGKWMEVPFFNDGKPAVVFDVTSPGAYFIQEAFYIFDDPLYYDAHKWVRAAELREDPRALQPFKPFMGKRFDSFIALPKTTNDYESWSRKAFGNDVEFNIAELSGEIYGVIRTPSSEAILVLLFSADRAGHAVCVIGAKKPPG